MRRYEFHQPHLINVATLAYLVKIKTPTL